MRSCHQKFFLREIHVPETSLSAQLPDMLPVSLHVSALPKGDSSGNSLHKRSPKLQGQGALAGLPRAELPGSAYLTPNLDCVP
jgi:hypothetical protein